jgi:hypothetical protein
MEQLTLFTNENPGLSAKEQAALAILLDRFRQAQGLRLSGKGSQADKLTLAIGAALDKYPRLVEGFWEAIKPTKQ